MMQGTPDPSMQATAQARFGTQANRVNSMLVGCVDHQIRSKNDELTKTGHRIGALYIFNY